MGEADLFLYKYTEETEMWTRLRWDFLNDFLQIETHEVGDLIDEDGMPYPIDSVHGRYNFKVKSSQKIFNIWAGYIDIFFRND